MDDSQVGFFMEIEKSPCNTTNDREPRAPIQHLAFLWIYSEKLVQIHDETF